MRAKKFVCCLLAMLLLAGVSFISCGNSSKAKADSELTTQDGEDFKSFLDKFTSSAAFQYTRIKFPLKTPSRRPSGLRKTKAPDNSLAHRTTWLRPT